MQPCLPLIKLYAYAEGYLAFRTFPV